MVIFHGDFKGWNSEQKWFNGDLIVIKNDDDDNDNSDTDYIYMYTKNNDMCMYVYI